MNVRSYIERNFIPWIIRTEKEAFFAALRRDKEKYFQDTYNHISQEAKDYEKYDFFDFGVVLSTIDVDKERYNFISVELPTNKGDFAFTNMYIAYTVEIHYYFLRNLRNELLLINLDNEIVIQISEDITTTIKKYIQEVSKK